MTLSYDDCMCVPGNHVHGCSIHEPQWVTPPGLQGWVLEHDPEKGGGIAPLGKYRQTTKRT